MTNTEIKYEELGVAKIQDKRNVVISTTNKGGFTIAQQIVVEEGGKETKMFMKHGIIIDDIDGLYNLRNALNVAISKYEEMQKENDEEIDWDE